MFQLLSNAVVTMEVVQLVVSVSGGAMQELSVADEERLHSRTDGNQSLSEHSFRGRGTGDLERVNAGRHRSIRRNWTAQNVVSYLLKRIHFSARWMNSTHNHGFCSVRKQKDVVFYPICG